VRAAVGILADVVNHRRWDAPEYHARALVT